MDEGANVGRLRWRCRRGMKELDVLLNRWLDRCWPSASPSERALFAQFLELQDPELLAYLVKGVSPTQPRFQPLIAELLALRA